MKAVLAKCDSSVKHQFSLHSSRLRADVRGSQHSHFDAAAQAARQGNLPPMMVEAVTALADLHAQTGAHTLALELATSIAAHPAAATHIRARAETLRAACEARVTSAQREAAETRGPAGTLEDWVDSLARN